MGLAMLSSFLETGPDFLIFFFSLMLQAKSLVNAAAMGLAAFPQRPAP